jgi:branched-chain amino acid transport system substrate-binding protein
MKKAPAPPDEEKLGGEEMKLIGRIFAASLLVAGSAGMASAQIKIGAVLSVTGPASFLGDPEKKTLEIYAAEINAKGGINGQKLQVVIYDDGGDVNQARTFATRLIEEDKVDALLAGSTTATTIRSTSGISRPRTPISWPAKRSSPISRSAS